MYLYISELIYANDLVILMNNETELQRNIETMVIIKQQLTPQNITVNEETISTMKCK